MSRISITILGTGNAASHLIGFFSNRRDVVITQIYGRDIKEALSLAKHADCEFVNDPARLNPHSDIYFIAVSDDAVSAVSRKMPAVNGVVAHISGSLSSDVLNRFSNYGVFYPLQTFSKGKSVNWNEVVVCIEGSDQNAEKQLAHIAGNKVKSVEYVDSKSRAVLHLAAVFACNFSNHMFALSQELLEVNGLDFDVLESLVRETVDKAFEQNPKDAQTGPAVRGDEGTLKNHIKLLAGKQKLLNLYKITSESIINTKKRNDEHKKN